MTEWIKQLERDVLQGQGVTPAEQRQSVSAACAALASDPAQVLSFEGALGIWVEKVAKHAYQTLDREVEALKAEGLGEEAIFELTVAAAFGAAQGRRDRALAALAEGYGA